MDQLCDLCGNKIMSQKRIGLFGGSFDPLHLGHEALVRAALEQLQLDEVWVIPAGVPVHRELSGQADAPTRMAWAKTVFADMPKVQVKDWEISSTTPVAAIDTLKQFRGLYPAAPPVWLCGADSFATMESWVDYPEHQHLCNVAVFSRVGELAVAQLPGWQPITMKDWKSQGSRIATGHLLALDGSLPQVSATVIREKAMRGKSLSGLINSRICHEVEALYGPISGEMV